MWSDAVLKQGAEATSRRPFDCQSPAVLIAGGAGMLGSYVAETLLAEGQCVALVDDMLFDDAVSARVNHANVANLILKYGRGRVRIYIGELADEEFMSEIFARETPKQVLHLAAKLTQISQGNDDNSDSDVYLDVLATTRLLELSRQHEVSLFVYGSSLGDKSLEVGGVAVDGPLSHFAAALASCELLAHTYHHLYDLNVTILRFADLYGPRGVDTPIFRMIDSIVSGGSIRASSPGANSGGLGSGKDFVHVFDGVRAVLHALHAPPSGFNTYNIGRGMQQSNMEIIDEIKRSVQGHVREAPAQLGSQPTLESTLAGTGLGFAPRMNLAEGIQATFKWYDTEFKQLESAAMPVAQERLIILQQLCDLSLAKMRQAATAQDRLELSPPKADGLQNPSTAGIGFAVIALLGLGLGLAAAWGRSKLRRVLPSHYRSKSRH